MAALLPHETGALGATTAFGKTVVAAKMIAARQRSALVLVHRRQLLDEWVARLQAFLDVPPDRFGVVHGGKKKPTGIIDIALMQSLVRKDVVADLVADYGHVIVDECHHFSAVGFEAIARAAKARHVLGLSATVTQKDGHHPIIFMQCGPVRYRVDARTRAAARPFDQKVVFRRTAFRAARNTMAGQAAGDRQHLLRRHRRVGRETAELLLLLLSAAVAPASQLCSQRCGRLDLPNRTPVSMFADNVCY